MRILFAAKHPPGDAAFGGVASWIETLSRALALRGHDCESWGPRKAQPGGRFDVGVFANPVVAAPAAEWCNRVLAVSHGIVEEERPGGLFETLYTSEEIRDKWGGEGAILRQPIDLDFWKPHERAERKLLLFYSYRAPRAFGLPELAERLGLEFLWLSDVRPEAALAAMQSAALVCASGRAALEAMACSAPTLICDWRPYNGGPLFEPDIERARQANYSGRGGVDPQEVDLRRFADEAIIRGGMRSYVEAHHDANHIAGQLLDHLC